MRTGLAVLAGFVIVSGGGGGGSAGVAFDAESVRGRARVLVVVDPDASR